jgi:hypothetical protein
MFLHNAQNLQKQKYDNIITRNLEINGRAATTMELQSRGSGFEIYGMDNRSENLRKQRKSPKTASENSNNYKNLIIPSQKIQSTMVVMKD